MRVLSVVGARPQFVKCAVVSRALRARHAELLVHTGQHYDHGMSALFFDQLGIPDPDHNLGISGGPHGQMTGRMLEALEGLILSWRPDWVLVYGDTNSTLAGALAAAKLHVPVAHVEAGLRSFNRRMPEELNRVLTDHLASLLLCPTRNAVELLAKEGIVRGVVEVGDVMYDSVRANVDRARSRLELGTFLSQLGFTPDGAGRFGFATLHRPENTDDPARLKALLAGLSVAGVPVLFPIHPRTRKILEVSPSAARKLWAHVKLVEPIGYLELLLVASHAAVILTDSGGLQKEAYFLGVPCVTLRDETEWVETVELGVNVVAGSDAARIRVEAQAALQRGRFPPPSGPGPFGDGHAAEKIVRALEAAA